MNARTALIFLAILFVSSFSYSEGQPFTSQISKNASLYASDFASASAIASYTSEIKAGNICLSLGRFSSDPDWFIDAGGKEIKFLGEDNRQISFLVVCDRGDRIVSTIENHPSTGMSSAYVAQCSQFSTNLEEVKCAVILNSVTSVSKEELPLAYIILISFAILLAWLMVLVLTTGNSQLKLIYLAKLVVFAIVLSMFTFFGSRESLAFNLVLLFFFFIQTNLSLAPFLLGIIDGEKKHIKLANFAILGIEFTMVLFILALVWKSGVFA